MAYEFRKLPASCKILGFFLIVLAINYAIFSMKETGLVFSDLETNRFEFFDLRMKEIARIRADGIQQISPQFDLTKSVKYHPSDPNIFLWPCGNSVLGVVDLKTNTYSKIPKLGGTVNNICHSAVSCDNGRKIITCTFDSKSQSSLLAYWSQNSADPKDSPVKILDSREIRNSNESLVAIRQLEVSKDTNIVFAVGSSDRKSNGGVLKAFSFDGWFDEIASFSEDLPHSNQPEDPLFKIRGFSSVQKVREIDMLLVAGHTSINLVLFEYTTKAERICGRFSKIRKIEIEQTESPIFGLSLQRNELMCLCDSGEKVAQVIFEHDLNQVKLN